MTDPARSWDAVVVAGGAARRMGGADKLMLDVGGQSLLERVVTAVAGAGRIVVVGPARRLDAEVVWCRESPPGGGPAAALAAALTHVSAPVTVVLAGDLPFVDASAVDLLRTAIGAHDGAVAVDADARAQWLCSAWRTAALRAAALTRDGSLHRALGSCHWNPVSLDVTRTIDCDTPDDLRRARELAT